MAQFTFAHDKLTLTADPASFLHTVALPSGEVWQMKETPTVRFSDGRVVPFPAPASEEAFRNGTSDGVRAVYTGFEGSCAAIVTRVWIERTNGDLFFEVRVEGTGPARSAASPSPLPSSPVSRRTATRSSPGCRAR